MYFTTPTLDFSTHADALSHIIQELYLEYPKLKAKEKVFNVNIVLYIFDLLTKLSTKRWIHHNVLETKQQEEVNSNDEPQKEYLEKNPVIKIIQKYLSDFDIEEEQEWKIEKEKLTEKPLELHLSNHMFDPTLSNEQKAYYHYLRGYLYNIFDYYHYLAEKNLSMAVKLNPTLFEAWSELAECYLKKYLLKKKSSYNSIANHQNNINLYSRNLELTLAKHCLERALKIKSTDKVLNNMALTLRKIKTSYSEYQSNIKKSIDLSKEAISYNIKNSSSWASLGISYLENYFNISRDINDLKNSLKAYTIAISHCKKEESLDMLLNKSMINLYLENYQDAINDIKLINQYIKEDIYNSEQFQSFSLSNLCQENSNQLKNIEKYIEKITSLIKHKCNIKDKFFLKIVWGNQNPILEMIKKNDLQNGSDNIEKDENKSNQAISRKTESCLIYTLKPGKNIDKYIRLRIISEVTTVFGFTRSFIAVDETNNYISLSIYNLKNSISLIGQEVLIYEPNLVKIKATFDKKAYEYNTIRIDLFSQRSLKYNIEKEWLKQTEDNNNKIENNTKDTPDYTLNDLSRMNLVINNEFLNDMKDIDYSKIMIDCS